MSVKFQSLDLQTREVTCDVNGEMVVRRIPQKFVGTVDDYVQALAEGLEFEAGQKEAQALSAPSFKADELLVETPVETLK